MKLFISYAHVDRYRVNELVDILRDAGYEPWFDHRLLPGQDWQAELLRAVRMCDAFLYALSPESVESEWCQWEFAQAIQIGKPIIPVLLQARTQLPDAIRRFQYADFSEGPTPRSVARLMGGLRVVQVVVPVEQAPHVTANPSGLPAQAQIVGVTYMSPAPSSSPQPTFTPPDVSRVLPPPFEWCYVPEGFVTLEDASDIGGSFAAGFYLSTFAGGYYKVPSFYIAKYPITNAQYQVFVSEAYQNIVWWEYSEDASQWRKGGLRPGKTAYVGYDLPRTNVTWYEALAFCRWLNSTFTFNSLFSSLHEDLSKREEWQITLPTEQQWQRAAQGDDGREYPWGNDFDPQRCNTEESGIGKPTPVTQYPNGASPYGVFDMAGNVFEWCLTLWGEDTPTMKGDSERVVRSGTCLDDAKAARAISRFRDFPSNWGFTQGFRIVYAPV